MEERKVNDEDMKEIEQSAVIIDMEEKYVLIRRSLQEKKSKKLILGRLLLSKQIM